MNSATIIIFSEQFHNKV